MCFVYFKNYSQGRAWTAPLLSQIMGSSFSQWGQHNADAMSKPHPGKTLLSPPQINICVFFKNLFSIFFSMVAFFFSIKWNLRFKFLASSLEDYRLGFWVKEQDRLNINWKGAGRQLADGITSEECVAFGEEPSHWKPVGCSSQLHLSYQHHLDAVRTADP